MTGPTDALLDELAAAHETARRAYWAARDHTAEGPTVAEHHQAAGRQAMAAVLALVERDYDLRPKPKGWLIEHVDHHEDSPVEECTFCAPAPRASDEHHYDVPCSDRPYCRIHEHHEGGVLP